MTHSRFTYLDGIRGIAALFILTRHTESFWNLHFYRSYLAVDLFFMLSGFVIAFAYDAKLKERQLSLRDFVVIRLIRLYPVFALSVVVSALALVLQAVTAQQFSTQRALEILLLTATTALFIPIRAEGSSGLFALNGPYWSLFFELIANFIYALLRPLLTRWVLPAIVLVSGALLAAGALAHGNLDIGFSAGLKSNLAGLTRSIFGIFVGLLLYRNHVQLISHLSRYASRSWLAGWLARDAERGAGIDFSGCGSFQRCAGFGDRRAAVSGLRAGGVASGGFAL